MTAPPSAIRAGRVLGRLAPGAALFLLAPILGELVSGHQAPLEFANPISWLLTAAPYGLGALAAREFVARWGKGWWSLLALGVAYGLLEEGVVARSIFDGHWSELGSLAGYDFVGGVNWTFAEALLHFHATISILASVAIVGLVYPSRRRDSWISTRTLALCLVGLALWTPTLVGVQALVNDPEWPVLVPPIGLYLGTIAAIGALVILARILPDALPRENVRVARPLAFGLVGFLSTSIVFVVVFAVPESESRPPLAFSVAAVAVVDAVAIALLSRWSGRFRAWGDAHAFALTAGHVAFYVVFGALADLADGFRGKSIVSIATTYLLWLLWRRVRARPVAPFVAP